jgi:NAD(P)H-hydrate repair Nnr-like enzyme with NAD(P)H-hydrate dehydratase domain
MEKPVVFDADSLHLVKTNLELMRGWRNAILTPNRNEFQRLASAFDIEVDPKEPVQQLQEACTLPVLMRDRNPYPNPAPSPVLTLTLTFIPT